MTRTIVAVALLALLGRATAADKFTVKVEDAPPPKELAEPVRALLDTKSLSVVDEKGVLHVKYRETAPPPGSISAQVITFPYQLVAIPKSSAKDVKFEKIE